MVLTRSGEARRAGAAGSATARLDLTIGRTSYAVERLARPWSEGGRAFRLTKRDGTAYDLAETEYGPRCDCPDFIFRRDGLDPEGCKHVRALIDFGLIADEALTASGLRK